MGDLLGNADSSGWKASPSATWSIPEIDAKDAIIANLVEALDDSNALLKSFSSDDIVFCEDEIDDILDQIKDNNAAIKAAGGK